MKILFQLAATFFSYYTYNFEKAKNEKKSIFLYYLAKQGSFFSQLVPSALAIACPFQKIVHSYLLYRLSLKKFRRSIECKLGVFCPNFVGPTGIFASRCWETGVLVRLESTKTAAGRWWLLFAGVLGLKSPVLGMWVRVGFQRGRTLVAEKRAVCDDDGFSGVYCLVTGSTSCWKWSRRARIAAILVAQFLGIGLTIASIGVPSHCNSGRSSGETPLRMA